MMMNVSEVLIKMKMYKSFISLVLKDKAIKMIVIRTNVVDKI